MKKPPLIRLESSDEQLIIDLIKWINEYPREIEEGTTVLTVLPDQWDRLPPTLEQRKQELKDLLQRAMK